MKQFAVVESNVVTNRIVADSKTIAEEVTNKTCVELPENSLVSVGDTYDGTLFWKPKPFPSWIKGTTNWEPPVPYPTDNRYYNWDEESLSWVEVAP